MHEIYKDFAFEAAHFLPHVPQGHRCAKLHGHSFRVRVYVRGGIVQPQGWVIDFADITAAMAPVLKRLDHTLLNEVPGLDNPTSEVLAQWLYERAKPALPGLCAVEVAETANCGCVYRPT
ncbi:MAG: 6-carboxytetrahydropterin synthase QueD [Planctomycetes bacterium]|nr:6-carboxytetrahydropterin synthase QueD [Planctomycetota bacterium]MCW8136002.1 6-carboxytetrahydropterin synthase QueD [Planctomycetota bacterium]